MRYTTATLDMCSPELKKHMQRDCCIKPLIAAHAIILRAYSNSIRQQYMAIVYSSSI